MQISRPFDICLDIERKGILMESIDLYVNKLKGEQASKIKIDSTTWLKEGLEKIKVC